MIYYKKKYTRYKDGYDYIEYKIIRYATGKLISKYTIKRKAKFLD